MKNIILLDYDANTKDVETEERDKFLHSLLSEMGIPIINLWNLNDEITPIQKAELRNSLKNYNVQVIDESDGTMEVYVENKIVGRWNKPLYQIKRDYSKLDKKKQLYIELKLDYWSIFEENK